MVRYFCSSAYIAVQFFSNRSTNPFMFGIILNTYLCSMLRNKFEMVGCTGVLKPFNTFQVISGTVS